jgi:hypothetical protein
MDRAAEVRQSAAFQAMTLAGRRVLQFIEREVERGGDGVAITLKTFTSSGGMCRAMARFGIKQCERLGFIRIGTGLRHANTFSLVDGWRTVHAVEAERLVQLAKLPKPPQVAAPKPVKPPKPAPTPKSVEPPRTVQQRGVTLPRLSFMDDGR